MSFKMQIETEIKRLREAFKNEKKQNWMHGSGLTEEKKKTLEQNIRGLRSLLREHVKNCKYIIKTTKMLDSKCVELSCFRRHNCYDTKSRNKSDDYRCLTRDQHGCPEEKKQRIWDIKI